MLDRIAHWFEYVMAPIAGQLPPAAMRYILYRI